MAGKSKAGPLPFMGVSEGFDLVKKVWGVTGLPTLPTPASMAQFAQRLPQTLPSMIAPTLDVEELDKRIADLRAVEQWLNLNLSMLRTTVQSLEVQRNTIATLKSFGGAMLAGSAQQPATAQAVAANWPYPAGQPMPAIAPAVIAPAQPVPPASAPAPRRKRSAARAAAATAATAAAALPLNPAAWWTTLQDQFAKIAATAAAEAQAAAQAAAAGERSGAKAAGTKAQAPPQKSPARKRRRR